jgi:hypothetical protein
MTAIYTSQSASGYNSNPPSDDGSATVTNQMKWSGVKTKLSDPVKTLAENINSQLVTSFTKVLGGGGITSISTDYTVQSSDQGKLIKATASLALTLGDATSFLSPFIFGFLNLSGTSITVSGGGGQTIDGSTSITIAAGAGFIGQTDGSNWFTLGLQGTLVGKQMMYGDVLNGTISEANATNAVTFSLKTLAGNAPSSSDPVLVCFRNSTAGTGNYVYRTVTAATSVTISSGSTLGFSSGTAGKAWIGLLDNAGTVEMFVVNCLSGVNTYPLGRFPLITTVAEGGAGAADSAHVAYSTTARTSKAYVVLGYAAYESGVATAGSWNVSPTRLQLYAQGVPLPGDVVQQQATFDGAYATGSTATPYDDTIPQNTEGTQFMTQAITPSSAANVLEINWQAVIAATAANQMQALHQDSVASALVAGFIQPTGTTGPANGVGYWRMLAATTSATTFKVRIGNAGASAVYFNGSAAARIIGGVANSYIRVTEIMA